MLSKGRGWSSRDLSTWVLCFLFRRVVACANGGATVNVGPGCYFSQRQRPRIWNLGSSLPRADSCLAARSITPCANRQSRTANDISKCPSRQRGSRSDPPRTTTHTHPSRTTPGIRNTPAPARACIDSCVSASSPATSESPRARPNPGSWLGIQLVRSTAR